MSSMPATSKTKQKKKSQLIAIPATLHITCSITFYFTAPFLVHLFVSDAPEFSSRKLTSIFNQIRYSSPTTHLWRRKRGKEV
jgi:hypothetical protein